MSPLYESVLVIGTAFYFRWVPPRKRSNNKQTNNTTPKSLSPLRLSPCMMNFWVKVWLFGYMPNFTFSGNFMFQKRSPLKIAVLYIFGGGEGGK